MLCKQLCLLLSTVLIGLSHSLLAGEPAVVSNINVVSDKVEDVSSFEAWKKSVIKEGMSDEQKALLAWETVAKFRHHDSNPQEFIGLGDSGTLDAFKLFNVYGYCSGTAAQPAFLQLVRQLGLEARAHSLNKWGVPEVFYDGAWHMFDPGTISYFRKENGAVASVADLTEAAKAWYEKNPDYLNNDQKIKEFQKNPGFKNGPPLLANCPTYNPRGDFPLNYFGWFTAMIIYNGTNKTPFLYEEAASQGYAVNIQLRKGERLTRNWSNSGLHVNADSGSKVECLNTSVGKGSLYYTPAQGDLGNGRVGNGTLEFIVPVADANVRDLFLNAENIALKVEDNVDGAIHVKDDSRPGEIILRMPSSYVYLSGELSFDTRLNAGGAISVSFSDNHGRTWKNLATINASGKQTIDLTPHAIRRYDYRLKFTLSGKGTGIDALRLMHAIQHSQRALPALDQGENKIAFNAGPSEGTITLEGAGPKFQGKQVTYSDLGAVLENIDPVRAEKAGLWVPQGKQGTATFPLETPGDLVRLRFGCAYRAGSKDEGWDLQLSFDDGKTYKTFGRASGPTRQNAKWISVSDIPSGTRKVLVRFNSESRGDCILWRYRIDADYKEPRGGFSPIKVTYQWEENGQKKEDVQLIKSAVEKYSIQCAQKPLLKSITIERP